MGQVNQSPSGQLTSEIPHVLLNKDTFCFTAESRGGREV